MDNARKTAEYIHNDPLTRELSKEDIIHRTTNLIGCFVEDIIKTINNIQATSLSEDDANKRLVDLEKQCGIKIKLNLKI